MRAGISNPKVFRKGQVSPIAARLEVTLVLSLPL